MPEIKFGLSENQIAQLHMIRDHAIDRAIVTMSIIPETPGHIRDWLEAAWYAELLALERTVSNESDGCESDG